MSDITHTHTQPPELTILTCIPSSFLPSLRQRQAEWHREEEERLAALPDPSVPPGHTLMSGEEKKKTLDVLTERMYRNILARDDSTGSPLFDLVILV